MFTINRHQLQILQYYICLFGFLFQSDVHTLSSQRFSSGAAKFFLDSDAQKGICFDLEEFLSRISRSDSGGRDNMTRRGVIMLAVFLLVLPAAATARRPGGVVMVWTGTYFEDDPNQNLTGKCPATGCEGDMVACEASERIIITKMTYSYMSKLCDDRTVEDPACDGRFTSLMEECTAPEDSVSAGSLTTVHSSGEIRLCFESGDCTGPAPSSVIASGTINSQRRSGPESSPVFGNSAMARLVRLRFILDGRPHRLRLWRTTYFDDFMAQPNDGNNCGTGCAVMGVTIKDQSR